MKRQEVGRVAMRAHMVLLSVRGHSAFDIAELHDVTHPTVYKWMDRFDEEGPSGLYDREREGRPREIGEKAEAEIRRLLEGNPTEEGQNARGTKRDPLDDASHRRALEARVGHRRSRRHGARRLEAHGIQLDAAASHAAPGPKL